MAASARRAPPSYCAHSSAQGGDDSPRLPDAFSSLLVKIPERQLTFILLAYTDRASSVFLLGNGDPLRSAFATAFLDAFRRSA